MNDIVEIKEDWKALSDQEIIETNNLHAKISDKNSLRTFIKASPHWRESIYQEQEECFFLRTELHSFVV